MNDIVSIPDHGAALTDKQGRATTDLQRYLDDITLAINADRMALRGYTVANVPAAVSGYGLIMVTDEADGPVPAFSDLVNWRRCTDRAIIL